MEQAAETDLARLSEELGAVLRRVLSESAQLAQCVDRIRAEGYDASVVLEATIGLTRAEPGEGATPRPLEVRTEPAEAASIRMTPLDKKFLRSLKITVEDD